MKYLPLAIILNTGYWAFSGWVRSEDIVEAATLGFLVSSLCVALGVAAAGGIVVFKEITLNKL